MKCVAHLYTLVFMSALLMTHARASIFQISILKSDILWNDLTPFVRFHLKISEGLVTTFSHFFSITRGHYVSVDG